MVPPQSQSCSVVPKLHISQSNYLLTCRPRAGKPAESVVNQKTTKPKEQGKRKTSTTSNKQIPAKPKGKNNGEQTAKQKTTTNSKTESQKNVPKPGSNSPCTTITERYVFLAVPAAVFYTL